ncbi:denn domain containing protein, putative [Entamoeba invadens IP1]|uniref:Denn domain containing protein, putative n=1 Tax=Entamoeba invadens IP1 TaxID=370355 RepID=A0A0A1U2D7_ENTIV|nr:denn domain containing protein, putative [Entamoeba invadens IP1]ELP85688.1 denn domain containing protein, putative [Entamoeba invadens IP1]|eukprot:XP_004185034.1 denn domain containing protein, putative [Entamoeba invadens IP1]
MDMKSTGQPVGSPPLSKESPVMFEVTLHSAIITTNETGVYCVCKHKNVKYRTKTTSSSNPKFEETWKIPIPEKFQTVTLEVCRHTIVSTKVILGTVLLTTTTLVPNTPLTDFFEVKTSNSAIGKILLTLLFRVPEDENATKKRFDLKSTQLSQLESSSHLQSVHRKKFLQSTVSSGQNTIVTNGLFSAVFTLGTFDIVDDINQFMKTSTATFSSIEQIGLSGAVTSCYPPNTGNKLVPVNLWNFCFGDGLRLKRRCPPEEFIPFVITDADANTKNVCFLVVYSPLPKHVITQIRNVIPNIPDVLYCPYALGVTSPFPIHYTMRRWLCGVLSNKLSRSEIEEECKKVIFDTPKPVHGRTRLVTFERLKFSSEIHLPEVNSLPLFPTRISPLFSTLGIDGVLCVFLALLEDEKVIVTSHSKSHLVYSIENMKSMIFPLEWCNVCIDILPYSLLDFLSSPMNYLIGVPSEYIDEAERMVEFEEVVLVDIDRGVVKKRGKTKDVPEEVNVLYANLRRVLKSQEYTSYEDLSRDTDEDLSEVDQTRIDIGVRICLFQFINVMLQRYRNYVGYSWVADKEEMVFSNEEFRCNQPVDRGDLLKNMFTSQTFQYFIQTYPKRFHHVFEDWQKNNYYLKATEQLIEEYQILSENERIVESDRTAVQNTPKFDIDSLRLEMKISKDGHLQRRDEEEEIRYINHLTPQAMNQEKVVFNNDLIQFCDIQIGLIAMMNEGSTNGLDTELLFSFLSSMEGRKLFLERMVGKYQSFCVKKEVGRVTEKVFLLIGDILRQAAKYALAQKDFVTPRRVIECGTTFWKIENEKRTDLMNVLTGIDVWEEIEVWNNMFNDMMWIDKVRIYKTYDQNYKEAWTKMNDAEKDRYRKEEVKGVKVTVRRILCYMNVVGVKEKTVIKFVRYALGRLRLDEDFRKEIEEMVLAVCSIATDSSGYEDSLNVKMRKIYDEVYLTQG